MKEEKPEKPVLSRGELCFLLVVGCFLWLSYTQPRFMTELMKSICFWQW